jgi:hypothetical protein
LRAIASAGRQEFAHGRKALARAFNGRR